MEPGTSRVLRCFMAASLEFEGDVFAALYPVEAPISLAQMEGGKLMPLSDGIETPELVAACKSACAAVEIEIMDTPVVLTARGVGLESVDDAALRTMEYDDDDDADADDDDDSEEVLVLAELAHEGTQVLVVQTLDPLYVVGKKVDEESYVVPSDDEIDAVSDTIEELVVEFEESMEADEDDLDDLDFDA